MRGEATNIRSIKLAWVAYLLIHLILFAVVHVIPAPTSPDVEAVENMTFILSGVAVLMAFASVFAMPLIAPGADYMMTMLQRGGLAQSVMVICVVFAFWGVDLRWIYVLAGIGITAHIAAFPTERRRQNHELDSKVH